MTLQFNIADMEVSLGVFLIGTAVHSVDPLPTQALILPTKLPILSPACLQTKARPKVAAEGLDKDRLKTGV